MNIEEQNAFSLLQRWRNGGTASFSQSAAVAFFHLGYAEEVA
ncbi:hypothetical protein [Candidatus Chlorohelix allophototropha]